MYILLRKAGRQDLFTCMVSRHCLLALRGSVIGITKISNIDPGAV